MCRHWQVCLREYKSFGDGAEDHRHSCGMKCCTSGWCWPNGSICWIMRRPSIDPCGISQLIVSPHNVLLLSFIINYLNIGTFVQLCLHALKDIKTHFFLSSSWFLYSKYYLNNKHPSYTIPPVAIFFKALIH